MSEIPDSVETYLREHHHITETAIGVARLALIQDDPGKAMKWLDNACEKIDAAEQIMRMKRRDEKYQESLKDE